MDKQAQAAQAAIAAQRQQEAEEAAREAAARKAAEAIIKLEQVKKLFVELGRDASTLTVESLAKIDLHALDIQAKEKALKAREEETRKRADQARRMEYLTRALREAERAKVEAALAARQAEDSTYVQTLNDSRAAKALARHQAAVAVKASLTKMIPYIAEFEGHVAARRMEEYKAAKVRSDAMLSPCVFLLFLDCYLPRSSRCADQYPRGCPAHRVPWFHSGVGRKRRISLRGPCVAGHARSAVTSSGTFRTGHPRLSAIIKLVGQASASTTSAAASPFHSITHSLTCV